MTLQDRDLDMLRRTDFMSFLERSFSELFPQATFRDSPHIELLAAKLAACLNGKCKRLIITLPPRSLKSITASVAFAAWILGQDPTKQIICASYGQDLADKHARDCRTLITSRFYQSLFPATRLALHKQSVNDFLTTKQGFRMATSVGGVLTGRGADIILIDDPLKPDDALSDTRRQAVNDWYDNTLLSRLNSKEDGVIIVVMQRLHQDDLVGHLLERGDGEHVCLKAIAEEDERHIIESPLGISVYKRKAGEVLDARRESLETLLEMKKTIGEYNFSSQYQQNPIPVGGAIVKKAWLTYYDVAGALPDFTIKLQSWDTANKSGELTDYSACTTWGYYDGKQYLLDVFRQRLDYPDLKRAVLNQIQKHNPHTVLIEDKASGTQLIQELRHQGQYRVKPYVSPPQNDKIMRLYSQTTKFESGSVLLPNKASWLKDYLHELTTPPGTKYDDQVDSTTQALDHLQQHRSLDVWARLAR
jgi:predicted phage terminase large subunit-like protein